MIIAKRVQHISVSSTLAITSTSLENIKEGVQRIEKFANLLSTNR